METRNKYLLLIIIVLMVDLVVIGYLAYSNYKMSRMDKLMFENNNFNYHQVNATENEISKIVNQLL